MILRKTACVQLFLILAVLLAIPVSAARCPDGMFAITTDVGVLTAGTFDVQEIAVPDKPVVATITSYRITAFAFDRLPDWRFIITYEDSNGKIYTDDHVGPSSRPNPEGGPAINIPTGAESFVKQINTTNFSLTSLTKRLLQHLVTHGKIPASTVTGTPEVASAQPQQRIIKPTAAVKSTGVKK